MNVRWTDLRLRECRRSDSPPTLLTAFVHVASGSLSACCVSMWKCCWRWFTAMKQRSIYVAGGCGRRRDISAETVTLCVCLCVCVCVCFRRVHQTWCRWRTSGMRGEGYRWRLWSEGLKVSTDLCVCVCVCVCAIEAPAVCELARWRMNNVSEWQPENHWTFQSTLQRSRMPRRFA